METTVINLVCPRGWHELSQNQLRYVFGLIASELSTDELMTTCLLQWSGLKVIGRQDNGNYLLQKEKTLFEATTTHIAELLPELNWLASLPTAPVRLDKIGIGVALQSDFQGVPFETYICVDNLYQGYLKTQDDRLLEELSTLLYPNIGKHKLDEAEKVNIFYWLASLKQFFSQKFHEFLQPTGSESTNLLVIEPIPNLQDKISALIQKYRAETIDIEDISFEEVDLELDVLFPPTTLNAADGEQ